jgi:uncharacterized membrane protein
MQTVLASPGKSLALGGAIALALLIGWLVVEGADAVGLASFLLRFVHVVAMTIWVGMIWFVNFIQLRAVTEADDAGRATLMQRVVPRVATTFRHASHLTLLSGALLLVTGGYTLERLLYAAEVHIPPMRAVLLWGGVAGGLAMWLFVNMLIWPSLKVVLGETPADADAKAAARTRVATFARVNLILSVPVIFAMVAAAHLY